MTELYQNVTVGGVAFFANPLLKPEQDFTGELNVERHWNDGRVRLTLFREQGLQRDDFADQHRDQCSGQRAGRPRRSVSNVDAIRMQGVELSADKNNVLIRGLQIFGSVTYVDSRILADSELGRHRRPSARYGVGKRVPNVPDWRAKARLDLPAERQLGLYGRGALQRQAVFDARQHRHSSSTCSARSIHFLVFDMKVHYNATKNFSFDFGIDNVFNAQYFLFHPFPGRTFVWPGNTRS